MFIPSLPPRRDPAEQESVTLRDRFAMAAMSSLLSRPTRNDRLTWKENAEDAYSMADAMLAERAGAYEKSDENSRNSRTFKPGCEVTNEPVGVIAARLKSLANDERIWRMPAKFQWTMLQAAWLLEEGRQ